MEIIPTLLIIGFGKLGCKIGSNLKKDFNVVGIKRRAIKSQEDLNIITVDIFNSNLDTILAKINPKYVIYSVAAYDQSPASYKKAYLIGLKKSIKAIKKNCTNFKHFFFISSTRVYGKNSTKILTEEMPPEPLDFGGEALYEGEMFLTKSDISSTILRLSGIYGNERTRLIEMAKDESSWPLRNRWTNRIHDEDAVNFISLLLEQLEKNITVKPLYLLTDSSPALLFDVLNYIRSLLSLQAIKINSPKPSDGKKLQSILIPKTSFIYSYSNFKIGYKSIIAKINK